MIPRRLTLGVFTLAISLYTAAPALAGDDGEGLAGETDDKVVTFFALGVLLFFTLVVILGTAIQGRLDRRKAAKLETRRRGRTGW